MPDSTVRLYVDNVPQRALELVRQGCDLEARLRDVPPSARVRGVWLRTAELELQSAGRLEQYATLCDGRADLLAWYPLGEGLTRVAVAGALLEGPERVHEGLRRIGRANPKRFSDSLLGRTLFRLLSNDPARALQQGIAARRQTCNYGRWELELVGERHALVQHHEEYAFLDSLVLGGAEGMFEAVGVTPMIEVRLRGPYDGVFDISW